MAAVRAKPSQYGATDGDLSLSSSPKMFKPAKPQTHMVSPEHKAKVEQYRQLGRKCEKSLKALRAINELLAHAIAPLIDAKQVTKDNIIKEYLKFDKIDAADAKIIGSLQNKHLEFHGAEPSQKEGLKKQLAASIGKLHADIALQITACQKTIEGCAEGIGGLLEPVKKLTLLQNGR